MPGAINVGVDRPSMACGLEVRVPFLDHIFAEFCARIPVDLKLRDGQEKYILRQAVRTLLPREIVERRKRGLQAPAIGWWRMDPLPEFVQSMLSESALRRSGFFDPRAVLDTLARHRRGDGSFDRQLDAVLAIQLREDMFQPSRLIARSGAADWRPAPTSQR
jgi:asparagine synthase (glutamine-hydrolysing)